MESFCNTDLKGRHIQLRQAEHDSVGLKIAFEHGDVDVESVPLEPVKAIRSPIILWVTWSCPGYEEMRRAVCCLLLAHAVYLFGRNPERGIHPMAAFLREAFFPLLTH